MASKKIGTSPSCIQKFLTSPVSPSTNFTPPPPKKKNPQPLPPPPYGIYDNAALHSTSKKYRQCLRE